MKIGIIIGSVREGRNAEQVAHWVQAAGAQHDGADFELLDLKEFDIPLLRSATVPGAANRNYDSEAVTKWGAAIDACDGFVFVTPEYNHGIPGAFKNAVDSIGPEWAHKAVAFVSYGADAGIRAVEQWRQVVANFHMTDVRTQVALSLFTDFGPDGKLAPIDRRAGELKAMLDDLVAAAGRTASAR